jgi:BON domain
MTQGLFGSVTPGWTGMASGPLWPAGVSFGGAETLPGVMSTYGLGSGLGPITPSGFGYANGTVTPTLSGHPTMSGHPTLSGHIGTPLFVPGGVPASTVIATMALRRGQPQGPTNDQDVEELLYDAIELMPGTGEIEVRCEAGRVSLTGSVPIKRIKRDVGELAWAIPGINDVQNTVNIATRRRTRGFSREPEAQPTGPSRKQA